MKKLLLVLGLFFYSFATHAQGSFSQTAHPNINITSTGTYTVTHYKMDAIHNIIVAGVYTNSINLGGTVLSGNANGDVFIAKFSLAGNILWAKKAGGDQTEATQALTIDDAGNSYLVGTFEKNFIAENQAFYGDTTSSAGPKTNTDMFYLKYDSSGSLLLAKGFGHSNQYEWPATIYNGSAPNCRCDGEYYTYGTYFKVNEIAADSTGKLYVVGVFSGLFNGVESPETATTTTINCSATSGCSPRTGPFYTKSYLENTSFVMSINANGVTDWIKTNEDVSYTKVISTSSGDVFTVSERINAPDIGGTQFNMYSKNLGTELQSKLFASNTAVSINDVIWNDALYLSGSFVGTGSFVGAFNGWKSSSGAAGFVIKLGSQLEMKKFEVINSNNSSAIMKLAANKQTKEICAFVELRTDCFMPDNTYFKAGAGVSGILVKYDADLNYKWSSTLIKANLNTDNLNDNIFLTVGTNELEFASTFTGTINIENGTYSSTTGKVIYSKFTYVTPPALDLMLLKAEYFYNTDPGVGNGIALSSFASADSISLMRSIPTTGLASGFHNLFIRVQNKNKNWSMYEGRTIYIQPATSTFNLKGSPLVASEYFFDTDPGVGNGTSLVSFAKADSISLMRQVPSIGLTEGFHKLFIRIKDSIGSWSMYEGRTIYIQPALTNTNGGPIVKGEYFFNTDPGLRNGISINTGVPADSISKNLPNISTTGLPAGDNYIAIRVMDSSGVWSNYQQRLFHICASVLATPTISGITNICLNSALNLTGSTVANTTSYLWKGPNGFTQTGNVLSIANATANTAGQWTFYAVRTGGSSCDTSNQSNVSVNVNVTIIDPSVSVSNNILTSNSILSTHQWLDCNNGNASIAGQTNQSYATTANGNYAVFMTYNGCSATSSCYVISTTGVSEKVTDNEIGIYPNPTTGVFNIQIDKLENINVEIVNLIGESVYQKNGVFSSLQLDLSDKAKGIYFVNIKIKNQILTSKLIIN